MISRGALGFMVLLVATLLLIWPTIETAPVFRHGAIETGNAADLIALTNSQAEISADRYDSFESPRGVDYNVPPGRVLYIGSLTGTPLTAGKDNRVTIGYGDDGVDHSITPPSNAVTVFEVTFRGVNGHQQPLPVWIPVPAGKAPWVRSSQQTNIQATGVVR